MKRGGKWLDRYDLSQLIESSHLFLLYRGVYDSVYDTTPGMRTQRTFQGEKVDRRSTTSTTSRAAPATR